jgi:hypothetical protein
MDASKQRVWLYAMAKFSVSNGPKGIDVQFSKDGKAQSIKTMKTIADQFGCQNGFE